MNGAIKNGRQENSLSAVLQTLGEKFARSETTLKTLQTAVSDLINESQTQSFETLTHLQALDRMTQELADFSTFTVALSEIIPTETIVDIEPAIAGMHLSELKAELCNCSTAGAPDVSDDEDTEVFF